MAFILKRFTVGVAGYGEASFVAKNKNQARMRAFEAMQSANDAITFKQFLKKVSFITEAPSGVWFGDDILVDGTPAHWIEHAGGNSVRFTWPDSDRVMVSHESDVTLPTPANGEES